jgi:hypothetical protein
MALAGTGGRERNEMGRGEIVCKGDHGTSAVLHPFSL